MKWWKSNYSTNSKHRIQYVLLKASSRYIAIYLLYKQCDIQNWIYTLVYNYFLSKATPFLQNEEKYLCGFKVKQNSNLNYLALHGGLSSITNSMFTRDLQKSNLVLIVRSIRMRPIIKYRLLLLLFSSQHL